MTVNCNTCCGLDASADKKCLSRAWQYPINVVFDVGANDGEATFPSQFWKFTPVGDLIRPHAYRFISTYNDYVILEGELFLVCSALYALPPHRQCRWHSREAEALSCRHRYRGACRCAATSGCSVSAQLDGDAAPATICSPDDIARDRVKMV
jgi:hypothetical protein